MPVINERSQPLIYEKVKDRNLQSQWFLLETIVAYSLEAQRFQFTPDIIFALHAAAANFLTPDPGKMREHPVYIQGSEHTPPDANKLPHLLSDLCSYLNQPITSNKSAIHFSAYAMWRLMWIHPFSECNGRTARVLSYFVYCHAKGRWLKGKKIIHEIIRENDEAYYLGLRLADQSLENSDVVDLTVLEDYMRRVFHMQFQNP
jgi:Fic family protein